MLPVIITYFAQYLINQGVSPTIVFSNSPFSPRAHYVYFQVCESFFFWKRSFIIRRNTMAMILVSVLMIDCFL
jgi:hypothetical protein